MTAREEFFNFVRLIAPLAQSPEYTDVFPPTADHNFLARIQRNGLTIAVFSAMEEFLDSRVHELMYSLSKTKIPYAGLPLQLRKKLTVDALEGFTNYIKFFESSNQLDEVEAKIHSLSEFKRKKPRYNGFGFSPKGSNIQDADISSFLKSLRVEGGWGLIQTVCVSLGQSMPSIYENFKSLCRARNKAAHNIYSSITSQDLTTHIETALIFSISFDVISTNAITSYIRGTNVQNITNGLSSAPANFVFIDKTLSGAWEISHQNRHLATHNKKESALKFVRRQNLPAFSIVRDTRKLPIEII